MVYVGRSCFKCGKSGHYAVACEEPERLCYNCKQPGHVSSECTAEKVIEAKTCFVCGQGNTTLPLYIYTYITLC
ncbi:uncharacterized protein EV154DRAFT_286072 [Mucor mucedo]|uniref:uncharacterized protein n=1 Tax=Mucor mucedo TaxID=29922 RepID=UPI002220A1FE|nr:uncharacterized protein EV154DRAFT_286072 [Mucor mucedo]KAI7889285.1 hypothetical protein EV154DRAFT_286072 [Mucor mucedo]